MRNNRIRAVIKYMHMKRMSTKNIIISSDSLVRYSTAIVIIGVLFPSPGCDSSMEHNICNIWCAVTFAAAIV